MRAGRSGLRPGDLLWTTGIASIACLLAFAATREAFLRATSLHPYLMGFAKFAILATMGELLSVRILTGSWTGVRGLPVKAAIWGVIGMLIVLMFAVYSSGVSGAAAAGLLPQNGGFAGRALGAFMTSVCMNLTFAPVFMAAHRLSDTYIDMRASGARPRLDEVMRAIDWRGFARFVLLVTIPVFWIPAHTITFLLPPAYRVLAAALLSIALGAILAFSRRRAPRASGASAS